MRGAFFFIPSDVVLLLDILEKISDLTLKYIAQLGKCAKAYCYRGSSCQGMCGLVAKTSLARKIGDG